MRAQTINKRSEAKQKFSSKTEKYTKKDQSYFLYMLNQEQLFQNFISARRFHERRSARAPEQFKLITAKKPDSQDICFLEGRSYQDFINEQTAQGLIQKGPIQTRDGKILGEHRGLPFLHDRPERRAGDRRGRTVLRHRKKY